MDTDKKDNIKEKEVKGDEKKSASDKGRCYVDYRCGCYVDPCGCYVDPCCC